MNFSNKKLRPSLVDQTLLNQYMKIKNPDPIKIIHLPAKEPSELQKIISKIFSSILSFLYNYFIILLVFFLIIFYLWNRYKWYQNIKKTKDDQQIKYLNSLEQQHQQQQEQEYIQEPKIEYVSVNQDLSNHQIKKNNSINNINLDLISQSLKLNDNIIDTSNYRLSNSSGGANKINQMRSNQRMPEKTVRFTDTTSFDAFNRNNINPKTGSFNSLSSELLAANENSKYTPF